MSSAGGSGNGSGAAPEWRWPFLLIVGVVLLVELAMSLLDMGPEIMLVAALGAFTGTVVWTARTLAETTKGPRVAPRAFAAPRAAGADGRVKSLRTGILFGRTMSGYTDRLHETLVAVIDDQLAHAHGIDRATEPVAAAEVIGPALTAFVSEPEAAASMTDTREINRIVTLIEQI